jgi:hypothetical protein
VDEGAILAGGDANLAEFMLRMSQRDEGSECEEHKGLLLVAARHPNPGPYRNAALLRGESLTGSEAIELALHFFGARSRAFVLWVREHGAADAELGDLAAERGYVPLEDTGLPQLCRDGPPDPVEPPEGVTLVWATTDRVRRDFVRVNADAWGLEGVPLEVAQRILFAPTLLDDPTGTTFGVVAYLHGKPASTCLAFVSPLEIVGGYWGATAPFALGRHLHDLTTRAVYNEAFARWPTARIAVCQNSAGAAKTVARMGFRQISTYRRYLVPRPT